MTTNALTAKNLTVSFGGLKALDGLNLNVELGQFLGLIGPNGSGKTTFFNVLTGIYKPTNGRVLLGETNITGATPNQIYEFGITRTFQRLRLAPTLSVLDNLILGNQRNLHLGFIGNIFNRKRLRREIASQTEQSRELLGRFSSGLVSKLYEPITALSMIDRRRVEVCRALISDPKILLLDEPSAGMTHDETSALMNELLAWRDQHKELSIILIEHEMDLIDRICDRCVVLNYGQKIAEGTYQEVANDRMVREAYLGED